MFCVFVGLPAGVIVAIVIGKTIIYVIVSK